MIFEPIRTRRLAVKLTELTLGDAIERGYVENFGIVIVRACNTADEGGSYLPCVRA